jgi:hypothetical protein
MSTLSNWCANPSSVQHSVVDGRITGDTFSIDNIAGTNSITALLCFY